MEGPSGGKRPRPWALQEEEQDDQGEEMKEGVAEVRSQLHELNTRFRWAQALATAIAASDDLCQEVACRAREHIEAARRGEHGAETVELVGRLAEEVKAGPAAFESRRILLEGAKPTSFVWHGPTSLQRVLLQDERFVEATQEPQPTRLLVAFALSQAGELRSLLLGGLHSKLLLGYMATASPNWESLPRLSGVTWDMAYAFVQHERVAEEEPVRMTPELLRRRLRSLENITGALAILSEGCTHAASVTCDRKLEERLKALAEEPFKAVLMELRAAVASPALAAALAKGPSGASTDLYPMICQSLAVMAHFDAAGRSAAGTMSLGAFSHALDAKHLLAVLHALQRWPPGSEFPDSSFAAFLQAMPAAEAGGSGPNPEGRGCRRAGEALEAELRTGLAAVRELLERCEGGGAEPMEAELMLCRLRQALLLQAAAGIPAGATGPAALQASAAEGKA